MRGYNANIEQLTLDNTSFRHVLHTGAHVQLVLMCLQPGEEIGAEVHAENDQFFRFESGTGRVTIDDSEYDVADGSAIIVPAGARHNIANMSSTDTLNMYTIYTPPHHKDGIVRDTREEAEQDAPDFDGATTE
ncbi:cupin domain-containing protein [Candidatus Saccharibacteria bacterium]|nr:cupin domain-containing protein [Candidatus Saccharibacteria bacterium]